MSGLKAVILAAGAGTRMISEKPKVLHKVLDKSMLTYVIEAAREAGAQDICIVYGHKGDQVIGYVHDDGIVFVEQKEQKGTGHAVMQAEGFIGSEGRVLILFGDTPLITGATLKTLVDFHGSEKNAVSVLTTIVDNPTGYGRIIRDENGHFKKSVEQKDATEAERNVKEINSGMYCFESGLLCQALKTLTPDNAQGEYYLPDAMTALMSWGHRADGMVTGAIDDTFGVNDRVQLAQATQIMQKRINEKWMRAGVTMIAPDQTYIGKDVTIGQDTIIYPGNLLEGRTAIGTGCELGPNCRIADCVIGNNTQIQQSTLLKSRIGEQTSVGPYAYVRPNSNIGDHVKIGDFVEIKNANIGNETKVSHLTYIGDADVGEYVNFGCGTVIVNYDGVHKHRTTVGDRAFIGCNTNLVSPVTVGEYGYTAAGSTITKDVPAGALAIARARQVNKEEWVTYKREKK